MGTKGLQLIPEDALIDTNITAAELEELTDGSTTALHTHSPIWYLHMASYVDVSLITATGLFQYACTVPRSLEISQFDAAFYSTTDHDASNYYTIQVRFRAHNLAAGAPDVLLFSFTTAPAIEGTTVITITQGSMSSYTLADGYVYTSVTGKTGSPSNIRFIMPIFRVIG